MPLENGNRVHSIYVGARISPLKDNFDIKDPPNMANCFGASCYCVHEPYQKFGKCLTSYPLNDGSFNIECDSGGRCV